MNKKSLCTLMLSSSVFMTLLTPVARAATVQTKPEKSVYYNQNLTSQSAGIIKDGTMYVSIQSVISALQTAGFQNTWANNVLNITTPSTMQPNLSSVPINSVGNDVISINGTTVTRFNAFVMTDPTTAQETEFVPIWYVSQALQRIGIDSTWDGQNWRMTGPIIPPNSTSPENITSPNPMELISNVFNPDAFPELQEGSTGIYVDALQDALNALGYKVNSTGILDAPTLTQLDQFQSVQKLPANGIVDETTWTAIQQAILALQAKTTVSKSTSDASSTRTTPKPATTASQTKPASSFSDVDLRYSAPESVNGTSINAYLKKYNSPLDGLGQTFVDAQNEYGVDANYLVSHAILESYWGKSEIALAKNNLYGYGAYDSAPGQDAGVYPSEEYAILFQAWTVRNSYLDPSGSEYVSPTLTGMNVHYASDQTWASSISSLMNQMAVSEGSSVADYPEYLSSNQPPAPNSTVEPVFLLNGVTGVVQTTPYYNALPYYPSMDAGMGQMFFGTLQDGSAGESVRTVQTLLNKTIHAGLTVDGQYGPLTMRAVEAWEKDKGLPITGEVDFQRWKMMNPTPPTIPVGQRVNVTEMELGLAGGFVEEWYYIQNHGWVCSESVPLRNEYRAISLNPSGTNTSISVYGSDKHSVLTTIHSGTFVTTNDSTPKNGFISVQICDQETGKPISGFISTSQAHLSQIH